MTQRDATTGPLSRLRERVRVRARELRRSSPDAERAVWRQRRDRQLGDYKFRRQHPIGHYIADFACIEARLVIELDGGQHVEPEAMAADTRRTGVLNAQGFKVLRFTDREALIERDAVLTRILDRLQLHHPHPALSRKREREPRPRPRMAARQPPPQPSPSRGRELSEDCA